MPPAVKASTVAQGSMTPAGAANPLAPSSLSSLAQQLGQAQQLLAGGQVSPALALLLPALHHPQSRPEALYLLTVASVLGGDATAALAYGQEAVAARPSDARCHLALGRAAKLAGLLQQAEGAYRQAIRLDPGHAEAHISLGITLKHMGQLDAAISCYERALALNPRQPAAVANLAYARAALLERQAHDGVEQAPDASAIDGARTAAELDPGNAGLHFNLGLLLRRAQRRREAIDAFNRALGLVPSDLRYCLHLGHELNAAGDLKQAALLYERWQAQNPPTPTVMRALANLLARDGLASQALQWAEKAAALESDPKAYLQLCHAYQQARRLPDSLAAGRKAIEMSGRDWQMYSVPLLVASYLLEDPEPIAALHADFGRALNAALAAEAAKAGRALLPRLARRPLEAGGRLRVGYLSSDFINHSVSFFMGPVLQRHDQSQFEVWCYHGRGWGDHMTEQLKSYGHHWVDCEHLSDEQLARRIRADGIDILVDLAGHTSGSRLRVMGEGPAALQISYLGYPTASGVPQIDHRISDTTIDPGDVPSTGSEAPLCLPGSMFCYRPPESPPIGPVPQLQHGLVTFGSFNNLAKVTDHTLLLWASVLVAVPGSRLLLKAASAADPANRRDIEAFMQAQGVQPGRLEFRSWADGRASHLALYNDVDVALDTYPFNGATTTCEALWMGVPVVTRTGRTHTSRMGASILTAAGQPSWVTRSDEAFSAAAVACAQDLPARSAWRLQARSLLTQSALCDERRFVPGFEALLLRAWHTPPVQRASGT